MNVKEAIQSRHATKFFDPDFVMPERDEKALFDLAMLAPTSFNLQNWRFVHVKDRDLRLRMREISMNQVQVSDASMLLLICADLTCHEDAAPLWVDAPQPVQDVLVPKIRPFYEGKDWMIRDEAMRSAGIAAQTLMLAAESMGYSSCPMIGFDLDEMAKLIHLPEDHVICMMLAIGKSAQEPFSKPGMRKPEDVIIKDRF